MKFGISINESTPRFIVYEAGRDWGYAFVHAPPLQEFGDMLTSSIANRIQIRDSERICAYGCVCVVCVCVCLCVYLCISVREGINAWVTDPRVQLLDSDRIQSRDTRIAVLRRRPWHSFTNPFFSSFLCSLL